MNVSDKSDQYVICLKQRFPSLCYKRITVCLKALVKFHKAYLMPNQLHPTPSAKTQTYLEVNGFMSEKGTRPAVGSVLKSLFCSSISCLVSSNAYMSRNPHKKVSFLSALILCKSSCICISRRWSVLEFLSACWAESESEKIMNFFSFDWQTCFRTNRTACSSAV